MNKSKKGTLIVEGKTKKVFEYGEEPSFAIFESKPDVTAFDNPEFTKQFEKKAEYANRTTCRVFELLQVAGIPIAYKGQISEKEFIADRCTMIPLEVVARRYAVGSYLKRHPELEPEKNDPPHRFHRLVTEFFLKTTKGRLEMPDGRVLVRDLDPAKGEEDPLIYNPQETVWRLFHPKKPSWDTSADLKFTLSGTDVCDPFLLKEMDTIVRRVYLTLEGAWSNLGYRFIDMKIEFGINSGGGLVVADVIDNDSWRLRDHNWQELSKQVFRDGAPLEEVEKKYGFVANLTEQFRTPMHVLVLWRASDKDTFPTYTAISGLEVRTVTLSGHKSPSLCLEKLEELLREYPDGGVIIAKVGMSNGLGPVLAARTTWPVISIPASAKECPEDVWSSLRMPSNVPMATIVLDANAIDFALNILAAKSPALYMYRQFKIEELDK